MPAHRLPFSNEARFSSRNFSDATGRYQISCTDSARVAARENHEHELVYKLAMRITKLSLSQVRVQISLIPHYPFNGHRFCK